MNTSFAKTRTQLMVLLMVVAVVALVATLALSAVISANADVEYVPFSGNQYDLANALEST